MRPGHPSNRGLEEELEEQECVPPVEDEDERPAASAGEEELGEAGRA